MTRAGTASRSDSLGVKAAYASGNFGKGLIWSSLDYFLLFFLTDLWGLGPVQAGLVVMVALVWDGLCGPVVGYIIDRLGAPLGRYLVVGAPLCALAFWFALREPGWRGEGLVAYALAVGLVLRTAYTFCDVPHNALLCTLSKGGNDAAVLSGLRLIFSAAAGLTVAVAAGQVFAASDPIQHGERISHFAVLAGVGFVAALWLTSWATRTQTLAPAAVMPASQPTWRILFGNRRLALLLLITFVQIACVSVFTRSIAYFADGVVGDEGWAARAMMVVTVAQGLSMPLWIALSYRLDKRRLLWIAYAVLIVACLVFLAAVEHVAVRLPLIALIGAATAGCGFTLWAMLPDAINQGAGNTGQRMEALTTAIFVMVLKCASGASALLLALPLAWTGYSKAADAGSVPDAIVASMCLIPAAGAVLCAVLVHWALPVRTRSSDDEGGAALVGLRQIMDDHHLSRLDRVDMGNAPGQAEVFGRGGRQGR